HRPHQLLGHHALAMQRGALGLLAISIIRRDCSKDTGFIQLGPDGVMRGFVDDLRLGLHATYLAPSEHESALVYARDRPAFASCDSAGYPAPRHSRWRGVACRREMSGPSPTWVQRAS